MGRAPLWILTLLLAGAFAGGLGALYKGLSGADLDSLVDSLAPPPPEPQPVPAVRLPPKPKAPKFKFATGRKRVPRPTPRTSAFSKGARRLAIQEMEGQAPAGDAERRKARSKKKDLKTIRKALMRFKRKPRLKPSNLSNIKTRGASSGAYFESPSLPAPRAPRANVPSEGARYRSPAGPAANSPKRRMRSIAPARGVTVPDAVSEEVEEEYYEEEEEMIE